MTVLLPDQAEPELDGAAEVAKLAAYLSPAMTVCSTRSRRSSLVVKLNPPIRIVPPWTWPVWWELRRLDTCRVAALQGTPLSWEEYSSGYEYLKNSRIALGSDAARQVQEDASGQESASADPPARGHARSVSKPGRRRQRRKGRK